MTGILKKFCQLRVRETTDGSDKYRGTNEVVWEEERIQALCERWAVEWKERGSVKRPVVVSFVKNLESEIKKRDEQAGLRFEE